MQRKFSNDIILAMEKETDTEMLARVIASGFSEMDKRFNAVYDRFDAIDERFDAVDERFDRLENRMERVEKVVHETNRLIDNVVIPTQDDHARRIKDLELKIA